MTRSLQTRLLLGLAAGTSIVLIGSGFVLYGLIRAELIAEFDAALSSEAKALATLVEEQDGRVLTEMAEHGVSKFLGEERPVYYAIWNRDGELIERSSSLGSTDLTPFGGTPAQQAFRNVVLPGQLVGRMVSIHFSPHRDSESIEANNAAPAEVTLVVARDTNGLARSLRRIGLLLAGVVGGAVVILMLVTAPIVRLSLHPLQVISAQIKSMDTSVLAERLDSANAPDEVSAVIDCLNGLLDRLHDAFQRERAFSANVAHELRTPLAGLRSTIDVALLKPREAGDYRRSLEQCLTICKQAESLTENLLVLARLDAGQWQPQRETIELTELLHQVWSPLATRAESRGLNIVWQLDEPVELSTDAALLSLILRNLLNNAASYCDDNGQIEIAASVGDGNAIIHVRNPASGLPLDLAERAFDRFWRGDAARSGTGQHAGLGLSLCQQAARALDGNLTITAKDGMFSASLWFQATARRLREIEA